MNETIFDSIFFYTLIGVCILIIIQIPIRLFQAVYYEIKLKHSNKKMKELYAEDFSQNMPDEAKSFQFHYRIKDASRSPK